MKELLGHLWKGLQVGSVTLLVLLLALPGCEPKKPTPPKAKTPTTDTLPYYSEKTFTAQWLTKEEAAKENF